MVSRFYSCFSSLNQPHPTSQSRVFHSFPRKRISWYSNGPSLLRTWISGCRRWTRGWPIYPNGRSVYSCGSGTNGRTTCPDPDWIYSSTRSRRPTRPMYLPPTIRGVSCGTLGATRLCSSMSGTPRISRPGRNTLVLVWRNSYSSGNWRVRSSATSCCPSWIPRIPVKSNPQPEQPLPNIKRKFIESSNVCTARRRANSSGSG
ncbi:hypothetical protein ES707_09025 [subsurface metagenome]